MCYRCLDGYMKFPNQCLDDAIVYGVGGALVGLCVVLIIIITAVVVVQRNRMKKQYSQEHKRYQNKKRKKKCVQWPIWHVVQKKS